jgi:transcriptional regulator with XRE-family HTH domain
MDFQALNTFLRNQIRRIRQERRLTVTEVARLAGIPVSSYSSLETGAYNFTLSTLQKVVAALNLDIAEIWPPFWNTSVALSLDHLKEVDRINWFRMREVYVRSGAESLCLLLNHGRAVELLGSINLSDHDRLILEKWFLLKSVELEKNEWRLHSLPGNRKQLVLCLKNAVVPPYLAELIKQYLVLWQVSRDI